MEAIKKSEVTAQVVNVTPFMAQNWLAQNPTNRSVSTQRVSAYAQDMKNGAWEMNGEAIVIDRVGRLKNGQHRLHAVVQSGVTVPMLVVFGVDTDVTTYDRGRSRSASDILKLRCDSELITSTAIGAARLDRMVRDKRHYTSDTDVEKWLTLHERALRIANKACQLAARTNGRVNTRMAPLLLAAIYALEGGVNEDIIHNFMDSVRTGIVTGETKTSAVVLRNDIMAKSNTLRGDAGRKDLLIMAERAIYDYANNVPRRKSYAGTKDHMYMGVALCNS